MKIREYSTQDLDRIAELCKRVSFELPDLDDGRMILKKCITDDTGTVRLAAFARLQTNAYLLVDGTWKTPQERFEAIEILEYAMVEQARSLGLDQVTAQVEPRFGRRLKLLRWEKSPGETWHKDF